MPAFAAAESQTPRSAADSFCFRQPPGRDHDRSPPPGDVVFINRLARRNHHGADVDGVMDDADTPVCAAESSIRSSATRATSRR
jgi:hypothetical protein